MTVSLHKVLIYEYYEKFPLIVSKYWNGKSNGYWQPNAITTRVVLNLCDLLLAVWIVDDCVSQFIISNWNALGSSCEWTEIIFIHALNIDVVTYLLPFSTAVFCSISTFLCWHLTSFESALLTWNRSSNSFYFIPHLIVHSIHCSFFRNDG